MPIADTLDQLHAEARSNRWLHYFAIFNRLALAAGFLPSGLTKVFGERFTSLSVNHPMGNYLEALFHTGYYYSFIGYVQVLAAVLLLIPRSATLGAVIYFPVILNICILSLALGFEGSLVSAPLMVLANTYLLCWDYHKIKGILPFKSASSAPLMARELPMDKKFPRVFFTGVLTAILVTILIVTYAYDKQTRNTLEDCYHDCRNSDNSRPCFEFCDCIHIRGNSFSKCAETLRKTKMK
jgi:uncharacterized membrane protein YphA (DoxX/SURF4 family)